MLTSQLEPRSIRYAMVRRIFNSDISLSVCSYACIIVMVLEYSYGSAHWAYMYCCTFPSVISGKRAAMHVFISILSMTLLDVGNKKQFLLLLNRMGKLLQVQRHRTFFLRGAHRGRTILSMRSL